MSQKLIWRTYVYYNFFYTEINVEFSKTSDQAILKWENVFLFHLFIHPLIQKYQIPTLYHA